MHLTFTITPPGAVTGVRVWTVIDVHVSVHLLMKNLALLLVIVLTGCVTTPRPVSEPPLPEVYDDPQVDTSLPPMPPGMETMTLTRVAARAVAVASAPAVPAQPQFTTITEFTVTNTAMQHVLIRQDMATPFGFGVAFSDDLLTWHVAGESRWTNSTAWNPFMEPGITEHKIRIGEPTWSAAHVETNSEPIWKITIEDLTTPPGHPRRFYKVYPLESVTGLPVPQ